jgi:hypothetical protein
VSEDLERLKALALSMGYRIDVDKDGTERLIRPDGTVAVIAKKRTAPIPADKAGDQ